MIPFNGDTLSDKLEKYGKQGAYPFHMPGHKRRGFDDLTNAIYESDITEIDGFDDLHDAKGIIKKEQEYAAELFGADESFFLINGSTSGIIASLLTVSAKYLGTESEKDRMGFGIDEEKDGYILMSETAHRSAYNGLILSDLKADKISPDPIEGAPFTGGISPDAVKEALSEKKYRAIYVTSPTYEGIVSDIKKICDIAHENNIPVIVDAAHGAHIELFNGQGALSVCDDSLPEGALRSGADLVIESLHKTLPSMTQTSILHVQGDLIKRERLRKSLSMIQSSSPSYVLMRSITGCLHYMEKEGPALFDAYLKRLRRFYNETGELKHIRIFGDKESGYFGKDPGKINVICPGEDINGQKLHTLLKERYGIQSEFYKERYVLLMTSLMDTDEGFFRLRDALIDIDESIQAYTG